MECCIISRLRVQPIWFVLLFLVGFLTILKLAFVLVKWVYVNFLRPPKNLRKYGSWAVVTGPTDGIGKSFAFELARKGLNLVLVGRNPDKLKDVSDSIAAKFGKTEVRTVVVDFSGDLDEGVAKIGEAVEGLDVGVLVNNVGVSYPYARFFHEVDEGLLNNLIQVNVVGTTKVTQAVLPGMLKRKRGAIVNIGSGAAIVIPSDPLYAVYAATKAWVLVVDLVLVFVFSPYGICWLLRFCVVFIGFLCSLLMVFVGCWGYVLCSLFQVHRSVLQMSLCWIQEEWNWRSVSGKLLFFSAQLFILASCLLSVFSLVVVKNCHFFHFCWIPLIKFQPISLLIDVYSSWIALVLNILNCGCSFVVILNIKAKNLELQLKLQLLNQLLNLAEYYESFGYPMIWPWETQNSYLCGWNCGTNLKKKTISIEISQSYTLMKRKHKACWGTIQIIKLSLFFFSLT